MKELLNAFIQPFFENLPAQLVGVVALIIIVISYQFNKRKQVILFQFFSGIFFSIHFLMLGAVTGGVINIIGVVRAAIYYYKGKHPLTSSNFWPTAFSVISVLIAVFTWESILSLLPAAAFICTSIALWVQNPKMTRSFCLSSSLLFIVYNFVSASYSGVITELIAIISILVAFFRFDILKAKTK